MSVTYYPFSLKSTQVSPKFSSSTRGNRHTKQREEKVGEPWPSSLNVNSRFSLSFSFFPLRLFLPPYTHHRHPSAIITHTAPEGSVVLQVGVLLCEVWWRLKIFGGANPIIQGGAKKEKRSGRGTYLSLVLWHDDGFLVKLFCGLACEGERKMMDVAELFEVTVAVEGSKRGEEDTPAS